MEISIEGEDFGFLFTPIYAIVYDDRTIMCWTVVEWGAYFLNVVKMWFPVLDSLQE